MPEPTSGTPIADLDTPALLIDLDTLQSNIDTMAAFFRGKAAHLRPHVKSHKIPEIARLQIAAGAPGICAAKLGEAEAMVDGGITDVLVANQVVGDIKIERLVSLAEKARMSVAVDHAENVAALSRAAQARGVTIGVFVEVDVGMNRCGVNDPQAALALARKVVDAKGLEFLGLMGYEGHIISIKDDAERRADACRAAMEKVTAAAEFVRSQGVPVKDVTGGGTMSYDISGVYPGVTEIQAGSYALMDINFRNMGSPFRCAMSLLTTVLSVPRKGVAILDAGMKSITHEFGLPEVKDRPDLSLARLPEEHGRVEVTDGAVLRLGDKLELLPSHGCTTVNLHDHAYAIRKGRVETIWQIAARGKST